MNIANRQSPIADIPAWRTGARAGVSIAQAKAANSPQSTVPSPKSGDQIAQVASKNALESIIRPSVRDRWLGMAAKAYTPERVENILRSAISGGSPLAQWELFDLMEDTSPRIQKNLNEVKRAVKAYMRTVEPWAEEDEAPTPEAQKRAKIVSKALWTMSPRADENQNGFDDTIYDIMDAWGKGTAVLEIDWEVRETTVAIIESQQPGGAKKPAATRTATRLITAPKCTRWIHPRFYGYPARNDWLGLNVVEIDQAAAMATESGAQGLTRPTISGLNAVDNVYARFPDNKFLICVSKAKSGHASTGAMLRPLAFWWAASNFTQEWFLNLAQIFGLPIRWATYDPNVPGLLDRIAEMLENMGSQAWAAFPAGTTLDLKEPMKGGQDNPQVSLLDRAEKNYDLLILGQTLTGTQGDRGSQALGRVHKTVRDEVVKSAAEFVMNVLNQQLVPAIVELNYGDRNFLPEVCLEENRTEDSTANATRDAVLLGQGVKMPESWFYKRHGIPIPAPDEKVIEGRPAAAPGFGGAGGSGGADERTAMGRGHAGDLVLDAALEGLTGVEARWLGGVKPFFRELIAKAKDETLSDADFVQALEHARVVIPELFEQVDAAALADALEEAMGAAVVNGAVRGYMKRGGGNSKADDRQHSQTSNSKLSGTQRTASLPGGGR